MDLQLTERAQRRRLFSLACNKFDSEQAGLSTDEKITRLRLIEEKAKVLLILESTFQKHLFETEKEESKLEKEMDKSEAYHDRWRQLEVVLHNLLREAQGEPTTNQNVSKLLHYPKIKLPTFDGNIRNWLGFWGQFQKVDNDHSIDDHDKFAYLLQAMEKGSPAEQLIKSYPPGGASYKNAIKQLQSRFGRDELLIDIYVRDLMMLVNQKEHTKSSLRELYDQLETKFRALETLGVTRNKYAAILYPMVESALPNDTLRAWERCKNTLRRTNKLEDSDESLEEAFHNLDLNNLLSFLQDEVDAEERITLAAKGFGRPTKKENNSLPREQSVPTAAGLFTASKGKQLTCIFCNRPHKATECNQVGKMDVDERLKLVQNNRCCFLCLNEGHGVAKCKIKANCVACGRRHHTHLCRTLFNAKNKENKLVGKDEALASFSGLPTVLLQTLTVILKGRNKRRKVRAVIDSASQRSYILKDTAIEMEYEPIRKEFLQHSLFGGSNTGTCEHNIYTVFLANTVKEYSCHFEVLGQTSICTTIPPVGGSCLDKLKAQGITVTDMQGGPIEILIGADVAGKLLTGELKKLKNGLTAIGTKLGWTVMGRIPHTSSDSNVLLTMLTRDISITDLWTLDTLGIKDPSEKQTKLEIQEAAKQHFERTVCINEEDRYIVRLPWLEAHLPLPDNYCLSLKRLQNTVKRLEKEGLYEEYGKILQEWSEEGIIEEVPESELNQPCHYLPHRHVVKEGSTTRIRPVFDASAKGKNSPSLNDCIEKGPNLLELIPSILTHFREKRIGLIADIRKAFLQISLCQEDRNFVRFLWYKKDGSLLHYRHCRVVFGVSCSPFLLGAVLQHHLARVILDCQKGKSSYNKDIIEDLRSSLYVDNCVTSVENEEKLQDYICQSTSVMAARRFDLRGWEHSDVSLQTEASTLVLGLVWNRNNDTLNIHWSNWQDMCLDKVSKRVILATAHRLFDPLGMICPVTLFPKLLLQRTWDCKIGWDQEVGAEMKHAFVKWIRGLSYLRELAIPRRLTQGNQVDDCDIHVFCDASRSAYAAVIFSRVEVNGNVNIQLVQARSRVAPRGKRDTSLPRLELLAATIAARLGAVVEKDLPVRQTYFWTDSTTVLAWIQRESTWGVFVHNRVEEIRHLTNPNNWRHVPGVMNPADLPSRGCSAQQLVMSKWWEGPRWLYLPPAKWPNAEIVVDEEEVSKERKRMIVSTLLSFSSDVIGAYFSSFTRIVRMMSWVHRFIFNCRCENRLTGPLSVEEVNRAEATIVRLIQQESFEGVNDNRLMTLNPFMEDGIIKMKTGVYRREDTESFRTPAILLGDHPIVKKLVMEEHKRRGHSGVSYVLNALREKFWVICGRRTVRSVLRTCAVCRRHLSRNVIPPTAPPPTDRVQDCAVFQTTGVDFAGPIVLRDNQKAWICLFTCAVYRAVHLELVTSLSTECFLQAFHRFTSRRGKPSTIYSDNGKNFVGAAKAIGQIDFDRVAEQSIKDRITWKFIPPGAPWWGGWWERLVGLMKQVLRKILGQAFLNYEEMNTVLCNCEAVLNDRPLTVVNEDPALTVLTPAYFLRELRDHRVPEDPSTLDAEGLRRRLRYIQEVRDSFKKRFRQEYLSLLKTSRKGPVSSGTIKPGDIVLIGADCKRILWQLGRVIEVLPGADKVARRARVKTQHGIIERAFQSLYPLEVSSNTPIGNTNPATSEVPEEAKRVSDPERNPEKVPIVTRSGREIKIPKKMLD